MLVVGDSPTGKSNGGRIGTRGSALFKSDLRVAVARARIGRSNETGDRSIYVKHIEMSRGCQSFFDKGRPFGVGAGCGDGGQLLALDTRTSPNRQGDGKPN